MITHPEAKVTIEGKEYTLLFGYTAYKLSIQGCFKFRDTYLTEEGELTSIGSAHIFHSAYINYCYSKELTPELSYDQFAEWTDNTLISDSKIIFDLLEIWAASKEVKKMNEAVNETADEKKSDLASPPTSTT